MIDARDVTKNIAKLSGNKASLSSVLVLSLPNGPGLTNARATISDTGYDIRMTFSAAYFLDLSKTEHASLFQDSVPVWEVLKQIGNYLERSLQPKMNGAIVGAPFIGEG